MRKYHKLYSFWTPWTVMASLVIIVFIGVVLIVSTWQPTNNGRFTFLGNNNAPGLPTILSVYGVATTRYTNKTSHYALSVPETWQLSNDVTATYLAFVDPTAAVQTGNSDLTQGMKIEIVVVKKEKGQTIEQYVESSDRGYEKFINGRQNVRVASRPAIQEISEVIGYNIITYIDRTNAVLQIGAYIPQKDRREEYLRVYREILSSLKLF